MNESTDQRRSRPFTLVEGVAQYGRTDTAQRLYVRRLAVGDAERRRQWATVGAQLTGGTR